jgi:hypothetical protein
MSTEKVRTAEGGGKGEQAGRTQRPKAISKEGKIGSVSCYVLDDGRCVLSKNSARTELSAGSGSHDFDRQMERLSKKVGGLSLAPVFEFTPPGGGVAEAIDDESFANIVQAYVDGLVLGKLHAQQIPVAQRAYELQKSWAKVGLRAHILTVTGMKPATVFERVRSYAERIFRREPREWERRFSHEFVESVCEVYGWHMVGRRIPNQMASVFDKLYRLILGDAGKAALKARNPHPQKGSNHHQHLADELDRELPTLTRAIVYIAHRSGRNVDYFWRQIEELLGIKPIQMDIPL